MKYLIIGLGNYGSELAEELTQLGHEVIAVDSDENKVEQVKDKVATSFILDASEEQSLSILPLRVVDVVIVAIGENFGASIKVVALLKRKEVKHIYARAVNQVHEAVLEAFNLDKILTPEKTAARDLVHEIDMNINAESFQIDDEYYVVKFDVPKSFVGYRLRDIDLEKEFNLKIISLIKGKQTLNNLGMSILERKVSVSFEENYLLEDKNKLVCYGKYKDFMAFWKAL